MYNLFYHWSHRKLGDIIYAIDTDADTISTTSNAKKAGGSRSGSGKRSYPKQNLLRISSKKHLISPTAIWIPRGIFIYSFD